MRRAFVILSSLLLAEPLFARTAETGTIVANPGTTVVVPVTVSDVSDVGAAVVVVGYDTTVAVCLGAEAGTAADAEKFTYVDSGNGRLCAIFSGFAESGAVRVRTLPTNRLMNVRFSLRDGTQGLFSDVTLQNVQLGAKNGLTDLSVKDPLATVNGMVRVVAEDATVTRLENAFAVWPKTMLRTLTLAEGDRIMADAEGAPIRVTQAVSVAGVVPVSAPSGGWQTGSYALLETPTEGLTFDLEGATNVTFRTTVAANVITYWADVSVAGEIVVTPESGELDKATVAQIREALTETLSGHPEVTSITVKGDAAMIPLVVDLGIAPSVDILGTTATASYASPTLAITAFEPKTGAVRLKVTPGEGNVIRTVLATGCIHVYGTSDLSQKMRYISGTSIDLAPYLQPETKGEADLTVSLGTHTFIKVKAELAIKQEGDQE